MKILPRKTITIGTKFWLDNNIEYTIIGEYSSDEYGNDIDCWNMSLTHTNGIYSENGVIPKGALIRRLKDGRAKIIKY